MRPSISPISIPPTHQGEAQSLGQDVVSPLPHESAMGNSTRRPQAFRVKRKPVPHPPPARSASYRPVSRESNGLRPESRRSNGLRPDSRRSGRPESSRSFSAGFAWISEAILWPQRRASQRSPKKIENPDFSEARLPRRFTSIYDPRMQAGLSVYDPALERPAPQYIEEPKVDSTVQKNLAMLDMTWTLPSFKYQYVESQHRTSIDIALATDEPTEW